MKEHELERRNNDYKITFEQNRMKSKHPTGKNSPNDNIYIQNNDESALSSFHGKGKVVKPAQRDDKIDKKYFESDKFKKMAYDKEHGNNSHMHNNEEAPSSDKMISSNDNFFKGKKGVSPEKKYIQTGGSLELSASDNDSRMKTNSQMKNTNQKKGEDSEFVKSAKFNSGYSNNYNPESIREHSQYDIQKRNQKGQSLKNKYEMETNTNTHKENTISSKEQEKEKSSYRGTFKHESPLTTIKKGNAEANNSSQLSSSKRKEIESTMKKNQFNVQDSSDERNVPIKSVKNKIEVEDDEEEEEEKEEKKTTFDKPTNIIHSRTFRLEEKERKIKQDIENLKRRNKEMFNQLNQMNVEKKSLDNQLTKIKSHLIIKKNFTLGRDYLPQKVFLGEFIDKCISNSQYLYKNNNCHTCSKLLGMGKSVRNCPKNH